MKINSISSRLLLASALLLPVFLGVTGFFLLKAFESSLLEAENARLRAHIYLLFSVAELAEESGSVNGLEMPSALYEPDFERVNSGLYAYIYDRDGQLIWRSNSSSLIEPPAAQIFSADTVVGELFTRDLTISNHQVFTAHYDVIWEDSFGQGHPYRFAVTHARTTFNAELRAYRAELWRWLGAALLLLLLAQAAILHWGLRPLSKLASALKAMQSGETQNIAGQHPRELQKIVDNLNQVLAREKALRQRYRNSLGDLAHSLKTPLAILQSKVSTNANESDLLQTLDEQVARMNQVVTYQLQRAVSDQQQGILNQVDVDNVVQRLLTALRKVYHHKAVDCDVRIALGTVFAGDEQDLMELLGNLLDNAFKYCNARIRVEARYTRQHLSILVSDDGRGVPVDERSRILQRGQRMDTKFPGQGIGLAVAVDIISSYGGTLAISSSDLGGAEFSMQIPLTNPLAH